MNVRLILATVSTVLEEVALVIIVLWGLPQLGIRIPLPGLIALMAAWGVISVVIYRIGSRTLRMKPVIGLPAMVGSKGKVASPLTPEGLINIKGELWQATSADESIDRGEEIIVVGQDALRLVARKCSTSNLKKGE